MNSYKTYLVMLLVSGLGSWLLTPLSIRLAHRWGALDVPSPRKIHPHTTPRLGGIAVFTGFALPWGGLYLVHNRVSGTFQNYETLFFSLLLGALIMLLLGIYDDIRGANATQKFLIQGFVAVGLWLAGYRIDSLGSLFGQDLHLPAPASLALSMLWMVGVTNAINLLDGIDGLVAGVTAVIALALATINARSGNILLSLLTVCLAGACLGFMPYNYSPARVFLGDSGSLTIGILLAGIGIVSLFPGNRDTSTSPIIAVPIILFSLPLFDTLRVIIKRLATGASVFQADRNHVHHRLLELGLSHRQTAWLLYAVAAVTGLFSVVLTAQATGRQIHLSALFALVAATGYFILRFLRRVPPIQKF